LINSLYYKPITYRDGTKGRTSSKAVNAALFYSFKYIDKESCQNRTRKTLKGGKARQFQRNGQQFLKNGITVHPYTVPKLKICFIHILYLRADEYVSYRPKNDVKQSCIYCHSNIMQINTTPLLYLFFKQMSRVLTLYIKHKYRSFISA